MVELLAKELRIPSSDLKEYLEEHVDSGLMLSTPLPLANKGEVTGMTGHDHGMRVTGAGEEERKEDGEHDGEEEEEEEEEEGGEEKERHSFDSLQRTFLMHYDELDRLRTLVIPPLESLICELRRQLHDKDEGLAEATREIEELRSQLAAATAGLPTP